MNNKKIVINKLIDIFNSLGIYITNNDFIEKIIVDSLQFIILILEIEKEFNLTFSYNTINVDNLITFEDYFLLVKSSLK